MRTLKVELGDRAYPIHIGSGLIASDLLATVIRGRQVLVVTNESIAPLYLDRVVSALTDFDVATVILPDGESHKHIETLDIIFSEALTRRF
jgi:3-dehydroquinate synthase